MSHHHHHHEHPLSPAEGQRGIVLSIVFNLLFVGIEAFVGLVENSLSLLSDAGHNLSDVFRLVLVLVAFRLSKIHANGRFTYGYRKSTVLISLLNAIILHVAVGAIVIESIHKFYAPAPVNGEAVSFALKNGESYTLPGLAPGDTVTVREDSAPGYTAGYAVNGGDVQTGAQVTLQAGDTVEFINTAPGVPDTGLPPAHGALPLLLLAAPAQWLRRRGSRR